MSDIKVRALRGFHDGERGSIRRNQEILLPPALAKDWEKAGLVARVGADPLAPKSGAATGGRTGAAAQSSSSRPGRAPRTPASTATVRQPERTAVSES